MPFFEAYKAKYDEIPDHLDSVVSYVSLEILQQDLHELRHRMRIVARVQHQHRRPIVCFLLQLPAVSELPHQ